MPNNVPLRLKNVPLLLKMFLKFSVGRNIIQHIIGKSRKFVRWSAITVWKMFLKSCSHSPNNVPLHLKMFLCFQKRSFASKNVPKVFCRQEHYSVHYWKKPNNVPLSQKVFLKFCSVSVGRNIIWQMGTFLCDLRKKF